MMMMMMMIFIQEAKISMLPRLTASAANHFTFSVDQKETRNGSFKTTQQKQRDVPWISSTQLRLVNS